MIHDITHCYDFRSDCPENCYYAQLERDLIARDKENIKGGLIAYAHLKETKMCLLDGNKNVSKL